jgi:hypothetical protein
MKLLNFIPVLFLILLKSKVILKMNRLKKSITPMPYHFRIGFISDTSCLAAGTSSMDPKPIDCLCGILMNSGNTSN